MNATAVKPGADFPLRGELHVRLAAQDNCSPEENVRAGLTIGWLNPIVGATLTPPGTHEILRLCFDLAPGQPIETCSSLRFVRCLGVAEAPVRNILTDEKGASVSLSAQDGEVCIHEELSFRRGEANEDGQLDISDPIAILGCLFLGTACSACPDATDANDDGALDIADPVYLLNWRFLDGLQPPAPFLGCGQDPTADELDECEESESCQ